MIANDIKNIVKKAQQGDEASFAILFDIFFDKIYRYINFRVNPNEVEDLVSEVFLRVVEKFNTYSEKKNASFSAWIFKIAHNLVIDFYRKKKELLGLDDDLENNEIFFMQNIEYEDLEDSVNKNLDTKKMYELLKKLPAKYREILELKYLEGFSNKEISKITNKSEGNIRLIQLRALREMRKIWPEGT